MYNLPSSILNLALTHMTVFWHLPHAPAQAKVWIYEFASIHRHNE